jgi:hypothetical protein
VQNVCGDSSAVGQTRIRLGPKLYSKVLTSLRECLISFARPMRHFKDVQNDLERVVAQLRVGVVKNADSGAVSHVLRRGL